MSDDEYYLDSPYDEFEEMLWDADPAPHLADDLAQHTAYSPVWQDNPAGGDLEQYHSDWEYYSDDYYDDDPAILRLNPADGTLPQTRTSRQARPSRGRKRKLGETADVPESVETKTLKNSIQGTVWAKDVSPEVETFKSGQHEKVALLVDWRKRFQLDSHKSGTYKNRKLKRDESWANDLSLSDMGLKGVREGETRTHMTSGEENTDAQEVEDEDEENCFTENDEHTSQEELSPHLATAPEFSENALKASLHHDDSTEKLDQPQRPSNRVSLEDQAHDEQAEGSPNLRKRQKVSHLPASLPSPKPSSRADSEAAPDVQTKGQHSKKGSVRTRPNKDQEGDRTSTRAPDTSESLRATQQRSKKRRLSSSPDGNPDAAASTASSRAKRVASTKVRDNKSLSATEESPASNTRAARTRKR